MDTTQTCSFDAAAIQPRRSPHMTTDIAISHPLETRVVAMIRLLAECGLPTWPNDRIEAALLLKREVSTVAIRAKRKAAAPPPATAPMRKSPRIRREPPAKASAPESAPQLPRAPPSPQARERGRNRRRDRGREWGFEAVVDCKQIQCTVRYSLDTA